MAVNSCLGDICEHQQLKTNGLQRLTKPPTNVPAKPSSLAEIMHMETLLCKSVALAHGETRAVTASAGRILQGLR